MLVEEFNEKYEGQLKFTHRPDYRKGYHFLAQWCPVAKKYERMNTYHLGIHRCHFEGFEIPDRLLESIEEFVSKGFRKGLVLMADEKHGTYYYNGSTVELLGCAALQMLNRRLREGWYEVFDEPKKPEVTVEQVKDSPKISKIVEQEWQYYHANMDHRKRTIALAEHVKKYTEDREYFQALLMLQSRNDHEYERVEVQALEAASTNFG